MLYIVSGIFEATPENGVSMNKMRHHLLSQICAQTRIIRWLWPMAPSTKTDNEIMTIIPYILFSYIYFEFSIFMQFQSPREYKKLWKTGVLHLPNKSTLKDYANVIKPRGNLQSSISGVVNTYF